MAEKEKLYRQIKNILNTPDSNLFMSSAEIKDLIDGEVSEEPWDVILCAMLAVRVIEMERRADDYEEKAKNLRDNAAIIETITTR
jgi:hypothetical protein